MKKTVFAVLYLCFIILSSYCACFAEGKHCIDIAETKCLEKAYSTADMRNCTYNAMDTWFNEIDKYTKQLRTILPKEKYEIFEISQRKWKEYQLAEFDLINSVIHNKGGTIYTVIGNGYKRGIVKARALDLKAYYETISK